MKRLILGILLVILLAGAFGCSSKSRGDYMAPTTTAIAAKASDGSYIGVIG